MQAERRKQHFITLNEKKESYASSRKQRMANASNEGILGKENVFITLPDDTPIYTKICQKSFTERGRKGKPTSGGGRGHSRKITALTFPRRETYLSSGTKALEKVSRKARIRHHLLPHNLS